MRKLSTFFIIVLTLVFCFSLSSYTQNKTKNIVDDILQIPKAGEAPNIDGELDEVWYTSTAMPLLFYESGSVDTSRVVDDHFSSFRVMWDDEYFYVFVSVVDDTLLTTSANPWENDCIELFFDGNNAKTTTYDTDDQQWRYVYGEDASNSPQGDGRGEYVFLDTDYGYNFELRVHQDSLFQTTSSQTLFNLVEDTEIGFEISNADRDNDVVGRNHVVHWWTTDGNTWQNASLFGTAILATRENSSILDIPITDTEPTIDGVMEEGEGWENANVISNERFEGDPEPTPDTTLGLWNDHYTQAWVMWDENNFYVFVKITDDTLLTTSANPWENDCVELFFDGNNAKTTTYDTDDQQWRYVFGEDNTNSPQGDGRGEYMTLQTETGWNLELKIPQDSLFQTTSGQIMFNLVEDTEIGFEISNADRDNDAQGRSHVRHWWTNDGNTWQNSSLFGTAILTSGSVGVDEKYLPIATNFKLEQNYPNPFNPTTNITYSIVKSDKVKLAVYNILGNEVAVLVDGTKAIGTYTVSFDALNLPSGVYFYKLETGNKLLVKKMMLLK
jgi:endo-1,4-beta-xylanase